MQRWIDKCKKELSQLEIDNFNEINKAIDGGVFILQPRASMTSKFEEEGQQQQ